MLFIKFTAYIPLIFNIYLGMFVSMNIKQIVGDNIRYIREKRNISQEVLALDANMSRAYVGEIERGKKNISVDRLAKLAEVLGVEPDVLVIPDYYKKVI